MVSTEASTVTKVGLAVGRGMGLALDTIGIATGILGVRRGTLATGGAFATTRAAGVGAVTRATFTGTTSSAGMPAGSNAIWPRKLPIGA